MKKFFLKHWAPILLMLLSGLIIWPLFMPGYFSHHDDLQVIRIFEMRKCFSDLQLPCRWVPDMGYGNGYPLFNFYGVFPYYLGAIFSFVLGYIGSAKFLFFIPLFFGGITMFLLAKELFGKVPGVIAGILFLFAPYRALDAYVRGDIAESFSIALVPLILFLILRLIKTGKSVYFVFGSLLLAAFFLTHNISTLLFGPIFAIFTVFWLFQYKWQNFKKIFWLGLLGVGMSLFFVLPAYFEKNLVQTESLTRAELDFRAQFVKVNQLFFDRSWSYSGSQPQASDTISYQIGWPHWWLVIFAALVLLTFRKKRSGIALILFLMFVLSVFMTHNKSAFIWEKIPILIYVQFPWRFLSIAIFSSSLLGACFISIFREKALVILALLISVLTIGLNWQYFRPEHFFYDMTDAKKLSGQNLIDQEKGSLLDYLPKTALEPKEAAPSTPLIISGGAKITNFVNESNRFSFNATASSYSVIDVPVFDFPNWTTFINGTLSSHSDSFPTGRIEIKLAKGEHKINGEFKNTPIRTASNLLSLVSFLVFVLLLKYGKNTKLFS